MRVLLGRRPFGVRDESIARLVFIDETWATTNMTRRHGRTLGGKRLASAVPHDHWKTTTLIGALRASGLSGRH
jgi:hypothetical protein